MADTTSTAKGGPHAGGPEIKRRDFLHIATGAVGAVGVAAAAWPFISQMEPSASVVAAGGPMTIDLNKIQPGQQVTVLWRSKPIFIVHRTPEILAKIKEPSDLAMLRDPDSENLQQPPYATNWSRSLTPEYLVLVGICTHLGCIPDYKPDAGDATMAAGWPGGYFCPCHGSKYDMAGRVFQGVPAPLNLPVPPYVIKDKTNLVIGENPEGESFSLSEVMQL
ncbi:MAG TPA: ubiquinol-cytochrome c reductase iron-sulfur subunit [Rhizomicrobium sp.]|jgi:ubiquinol-cytochrome c reductase iron-sulfur subunit|nr:ubiquinol-cytochrome c reductase iron-sulfur subunit [Rhizomicrobium sp.]